MTPLGASWSPKALFLSPEAPVAGAGGGGLRSASLLEYLRQKYTVDVVDFALRRHSKTPAARVWRNTVRLVRGVPPLFDRYSGYEEQLESRLTDSKYALGVVEHFWCASYAALLRDALRTPGAGSAQRRKRTGANARARRAMAGFLGVRDLRGGVPRSGANVAAAV